MDMTGMIGSWIIGIYRWMLEHLFVINIVFSVLIIFFQRRNPTTVWAWLLLLNFIPVLGFVLYLVLGQNFHKERMFKMKEIEGEIKYAVGPPAADAGLERVGCPDAGAWGDAALSAGAGGQRERPGASAGDGGAGGPARSDEAGERPQAGGAGSGGL